MALCRPLALALLIALLASAAPADPTDPVTVTLPPDVGEVFSPGVRLVADLPQDYVEEEFFVEGRASSFSYEDPPVPGELVEFLEDAYRTRMIVRRPADPADFNGTVIIEWWNTTATFDVAPVWDPSAEYIAREGIVYVGWTNSNQGMTHLTSGCSLFNVLPPTCGDRYVSLFLPDDGQAYEIGSQIANLLKSDSDQNPLPEGFDVKRIFHAGQSQQGGSMVTYASNFHFDVNDGYFIQAAGGARRLCGNSNNNPPPGCIPRLPNPEDRLVRRDLPVPVYRAVTENDVARGTTPQDDSGLFRYYEITGTAHTTVHENVELLPEGTFGPGSPPLFLEDACLFPINSLADGPVLGSHIYNALWQNMRNRVSGNRLSPPGAKITRDANGEILRDELGLALGGIRPTQVSVPIHTYPPINQPNPANLPGPLILLGQLFCVLSGVVEPLAPEIIDDRYPTNASYVQQVTDAADELLMRGYMLPEDVDLVIQQAIDSGVGGCGLGFELVFVLPPLAWLRARRRRARD